MSENHQLGPFDVPELPARMPRRLKPFVFLFFVIIIQFSGAIYLAAVSDMVGTTALMQQDVMMAGYAQLIGLAIGLGMMFRIKFRYSARTILAVSCAVLILANIICSSSDNVVILTATCLVAGWFRIIATFACNSTIRAWVSPKFNMAVFFCYIGLLVDVMIQLSGVMTVYTALEGTWETMQGVVIVSLALELVLSLILLKPLHGDMWIPLKGIDWTGAFIWVLFMLSFTFICVYGNFYDWWESAEITGATILCIASLALNLWRATFIEKPFISLAALKNQWIWRTIGVNLVFYTIIATEHVFEHGYAGSILGFDEENIIDLNWYVVAGIIAGAAITYFTFAQRAWRFKTMLAIAFGLTGLYLAYFYFFIDTTLEKEMLFFPLFCRGIASVMISIIVLTMVQGSIPFPDFTQGLTINGFTGAVAAAALGPALIGEWLGNAVARNAAIIGSAFTSTDGGASFIPLSDLYGMVYGRATIVSMKEIFGWLLIATIFFLLLIVVSYGRWRPVARLLPWNKVRRLLRRQAV